MNDLCVLLFYIYDKNIMKKTNKNEFMEAYGGKWLECMMIEWSHDARYRKLEIQGENKPIPVVNSLHLSHST